MLTENSLANVFFVGGVGIFKKLFDVICVCQTGKVYKRPIILYGKDFWQPIKEKIDSKLLSYGFISEKDIYLTKVIDKKKILMILY